MVEPFNGRARQPVVVAIQQIQNLSLESTVIGWPIKDSGAASRIELAIETPQKFVNRILTIEEIKEVTEYFSTSAIDCNCIITNAVR
jgi:hypothetical protein